MTKTTYPNGVKRHLIELAAVFVSLFLTWFGSELYYARKITPRGLESVQDFLDRFGEPKSVRVVTRDSQSFYEFTSPMSPFLAFAIPSSPAVYVFDEKGKFVAWCSDPGDDPDHRKQWPFTGTNEFKVDSIRSRFLP